MRYQGIMSVLKSLGLARCFGCLLLLTLVDCGALTRRVTRPLVHNLTTAIAKHPDPETVRQGAPSFLLIADGMVEGNPENFDALLNAADLYSTYTSAFVAAEDDARAVRLSARARDYAFRAVGLVYPDMAKAASAPFKEFEPFPALLGKEDVHLLFVWITAWAGDIKANAGDWDKIAEIAKVQLLAERLLELDETYQQGAPHLVMGILYTLLPAAMGGKPELARTHFERAIAMSHGDFLQAHVIFAQQYARLVFDRELHDQLLTHVVEHEKDIHPQWTLANALAREQARRMLEDADDYF